MRVDDLDAGDGVRLTGKVLLYADDREVRCRARPPHKPVSGEQAFEGVLDVRCRQRGTVVEFNARPELEGVRLSVCVTCGIAAASFGTILLVLTSSPTSPSKTLSTAWKPAPFHHFVRIKPRRDGLHTEDDRAGGCRGGSSSRSRRHRRKRSAQRDSSEAVPPRATNCLLVSLCADIASLPSLSSLNSIRRALTARLASAGTSPLRRDGQLRVPSDLPLGLSMLVMRSRAHCVAEHGARDVLERVAARVPRR